MIRHRLGSRAVVTLAAAAAAALGFFFQAAAPASALNLRSITTFTADYYFATGTTPDSYYVQADQVLLVGLFPFLTVQAMYTRTDAAQVGGLDSSTNMFTLGPVINFSDTTYAIATYGLGFDSTPQHNLIHEANASINWETDLAAILFNVKWDYFTSGGNWYILPSLGGSFHILPQLGVFGDFFLAYSPDTSTRITGAFWGETDYAFTDIFTMRAGFTMSFSQSLGLTAILGADFNLTPRVALKYKVSYLYNAVQYFSISVPTTSNQGIENLLTLDWKI